MEKKILTETLQEEFKKCSRCGTCMAHCPLYEATGMEAYVCRGKLELLAKLEKGEIQWTDKLADIFSHCLLCGGCHAGCPNGVSGEKIIQLARKNMAELKGLGPIKKNIFQHLLKNNGAMTAMGKTLYLSGKLGIRPLLRHSGILKLFPKNLADLEKLVPFFPNRTFASSCKANCRSRQSKIPVIR